ncbi:MAG: MBOAT family protein [Methylobacteriaceae bacterium]|nr:MBOAT family protein [Methylobacteriaceae bacterium]
MVFSSNLFIFAFVPIFFSIYYLLPYRARNPFIFLASIFFYEFGAGPIVLVLIGSIIFNYAAGRAIEATAGRRGLSGAVFWLAVAVNVAVLVYYKYAGFLWGAANDLTGGALSAHGLPRPDVVLPIGISFFTFQALSYIADIHTGHCRSARSLLEFGMYHSLFPQLIAGPIVRYAEIRGEILKRYVSMAMVSDGFARFALGLGKKIIIADHAGAIADAVFKLAPDQLSPGVAWLGAIAYSIQILFDFSGYSDMAIGLGLLLGFHFPENFNHPYRSQSVTEFWRRWHMTLSRWFRDYLYIPLGGNRKGPYRTYANLVLVFFLCGLWHGAGYTFVIWGLYHGLLLMTERFALHRWNLAPRGFAGQAYTLLMVVVGWVFFRSTSLPHAAALLQQMSLLGEHGGDRPSLVSFLAADQASYLAVGIVLALVPVIGLLPQRSALVLAARRLASLVMFVYSAALLSANTFNPFLYFRF